MMSQCTDERNNRRWNASQCWPVAFEVSIYVNDNFTGGQHCGEFGIHLLPCSLQTSNCTHIQSGDYSHHRRVILQQSTPLETKPVSLHESIYASEKEKLTSATLMKCFTTIARFREFSLSRIESATQLAIYTPKWAEYVQTE